MRITSGSETRYEGEDPLKVTNLNDTPESVLGCSIPGQNPAEERERGWASRTTMRRRGIGLRSKAWQWWGVSVILMDNKNSFGIGGKSGSS